MNRVQPCQAPLSIPAFMKAGPSPTDTLHDSGTDTPCRPDSSVLRVVQRSLVVVPVLPDGSPGRPCPVGEAALCVGGAEISLQLNAPVELPTLDLLLMFPQPDGSRPCAGMEVLSTQVTGTNRLRVRGRLGGFAAGLLQPEQLAPTFDPAGMEYRFGIADEILRQWAALGVLEPVSVDRVQVCPQCHGLPTYRRGCRQCGSIHLDNDRLIHHFACAHVGMVADFETPAGLTCPKCRTRGMVVGTDYEYATGPYRCAECHWSDVELEHVAQCLRCHLRFPGHQAHELELRGYRAHRLDVLALAQAS
jgi:hypothetical protein